NQTSASFSFSSSEGGSSFECSLDGAPFAACTSAQGYSGLAEGAHSFQVRATDPAGNTDAAPASYFWTVDTTAPAAPVLTEPLDGSFNTSGIVTVAGTAEPGSSVEVFDGASSKGLTAADGAGSWTKTLTGVADGAHIYTAKATDAAGNSSSSSSAHTVTVDTGAPETTIASGPPNPTNQTSASFSFSSSEGGSSFECSLDGAAFASCTSAQGYTGLAEGAHSFQVRATDAAGNTDASAAGHSWTIDTSAPETTIASGPPNPTNQTSASFSFSSSEGGSSFECSLDGAPFASCTSAQGYSGLAEGAHTFEVRATDAAGNTDGTAAGHSWTVDTTAPETTIASGPPDPTADTSASFVFDSSEAGSSFECSLDGAAFATCTSPQDYTSLGAGSHMFEVRATDPAGNADATAAGYAWTVV
ncbi:MAG: Ig-like domain-containing protein, partial [Gaiellaceae bacterium]